MFSDIRKSSTDALNALAWAANRAGLSYGQYYSQLSVEEMQDILCEYRAMKQKQREEEAARLALNKKKKS